MDKILKDWIDECIKKGTFANKMDAIEFCVGATRAFCIAFELTQDKIKNANVVLSDDMVSFPLKFDECAFKHTTSLFDKLTECAKAMRSDPCFPQLPKEEQK